MAKFVVEDVVPHIWTEKEAYSSGHTAFRIRVEQFNNPFKGELGDAWLRGYKAAEAADISYKFKQREERPYDSKRPRNSFRDNSR